MALQEVERAFADSGGYHRREKDDITLIALKSMDCIDYKLQRRQLAR